MTEKGKFIVIEGIDGSGKGTQVGLLKERMERNGMPVATFSFPRYTDTFFGKLVGRELKGEFGTLQEISPYLFSLPFAFDRWESKNQINYCLENGINVLNDRYTLSNLAHQTSKLPKDKRKEFIDYILKMEYEILGIPREDLNILLYVDTEIGQKMVDKKGQREYLEGKTRDIQEEDIEHLQESSIMYIELASTMKNVRMINCCQNGEMMNKVLINDLIWNEIKDVLMPHEGRIVRERG